MVYIKSNLKFKSRKDNTPVYNEHLIKTRSVTALLKAVLFFIKSPQHGKCQYLTIDDNTKMLIRCDHNLCGYKVCSVTQTNHAEQF